MGIMIHKFGYKNANNDVSNPKNTNENGHSRWDSFYSIIN